MKRFRAFGITFLLIFLAMINFIIAQSYPAPFVQNENISNSITIIPTPSQYQIDCFTMGGCYLSGTCYASGSITLGTIVYDNEHGNSWIVQTENTSSYCSWIIGSGMSDNHAFLNQLNEGQSCIQNYQCITNICSDNVCVNLTKEENKISELTAEYTQLKAQLDNQTNQSYTLLGNQNNSINQTNETSLAPVTGGAIGSQNTNNLWEKIKWFFSRILVRNKY